MTLLGSQLLDAVFQHRPEVHAVELDGETVVFLPQRESLTLLDPVSTVIWTLLDGSASVRTLCSELADAYQAPLEQVQHDVLQLVAQLRSDELLLEP